MSDLPRATEGDWTRLGVASPEEQVDQSARFPHLRVAKLRSRVEDRRIDAVVLGVVTWRGEEFLLVVNPPNILPEGWKAIIPLGGARGPLGYVAYLPAIEWEIVP